MKNKIEDLRDHLFATLEALRDEEKPMDLDRAKTIAEVAQALINSAKAEVEYLRETGGKGSGFIPNEPRRTLPPPINGQARPVRDDG